MLVWDQISSATQLSYAIRMRSMLRASLPLLLFIYLLYFISAFLKRRLSGSGLSRNLGNNRVSGQISTVNYGTVP